MENVPENKPFKVIHLIINIGFTVIVVYGYLREDPALMFLGFLLGFILLPIIKTLRQLQKQKKLQLQYVLWLALENLYHTNYRMVKIFWVLPVIIIEILVFRAAFLAAFLSTVCLLFATGQYITGKRLGVSDLIGSDNIIPEFIGIFLASYFLIWLRFFFRDGEPIVNLFGWYMELYDKPQYWLAQRTASFVEK